MGYVYSPFRIGDLIEGIFGKTPPDIDLEIYDGYGPSRNGLMYDSDSDPYGLAPSRDRLFSKTEIISIYGQQWTFVLSARPSFERIDEHYQPMAILGFGLAISLLLFLFTRSQEITRERAVSLARDMTSVLRAMLLLLCCAGMACAQTSGRRASEPVSADRIVAVVNDEVVRLPALGEGPAAWRRLPGSDIRTPL